MLPHIAAQQITTLSHAPANSNTLQRTKLTGTTNQSSFNTDLNYSQRPRLRLNIHTICQLKIENTSSLSSTFDEVSNSSIVMIKIKRFNTFKRANARVKISFASIQNSKHPAPRSRLTIYLSLRM